MEPPNFIAEPPSLIYFSNTTGTLIDCQGQGNPQPNVTWLLHNDRMVTDIPNLRYLILLFNDKKKSHDILTLLGNNFYVNVNS